MSYCPNPNDWPTPRERAIADASLWAFLIAMGLLIWWLST